MGKKPKYDLVLCVLLATLGFLPMLQGWFQLFPTKPLNGVIKETSKPDFSLEAYRSGDYSRQAEAYTSQHIGFREPIIRLYNQYLWDCYHKTYANDVVAGREGWLYYPQNVRDYYGQELLRWHPSTEEARKKFNQEVKYLNWTRSILKENGVEFLVFMAPEKSFLYPEYLPEGERDTTTFNACDYFAQRLTESDFPHIEMTRWFQQMKDTVDYPLIPQAGAHWIFPSVYAVDSLTHLMGELKGIQLPKIKIGEAYPIRERDHDYDNDLEELLNLTFPLRHQYGYCPRHKVSIESDSTSVRPKVLFVGNSYFWAMKYFVPFQELFEDTEFWFYASTAYFGEDLSQTISVTQLDLVEKLLEFDYVVWFATGNQLNKGTESFAQRALVNLCYDKKEIGSIYTRLADSLRHDPATIASMETPLADSNYKQLLWPQTDLLLYSHPERYFPSLRSDSLPANRNPHIKEVIAFNKIRKHPEEVKQLVEEMVKELQSKPALMQQIEEKAAIHHRTVEEQTLYDARWIVNDKIKRGVYSLD